VLTFEELIELSATPNPNQPIRARLERVLNSQLWSTPPRPQG
jgi:hypothetical protein